MTVKRQGETATAVVKVLKAVAEMYGVELVDNAARDAADDGSTEDAGQEPTVYFVRAGTDGPIKIGATTDVGRRLRALQTSNPAELTVIAVIPPAGEECGFELEQRIHGMFTAERIRGEWFQPSTRLLDWIKQNTNALSSRVCWGGDDESERENFK